MYMCDIYVYVCTVTDHIYVYVCTITDVCSMNTYGILLQYSVLLYYKYTLLVQYVLLYYKYTLIVQYVL